MSFGVDTLGLLTEKLKQLVNDTQDNYESFFDSTQLFKQGKMENNEYFSRMGEFLVSSSALNFLACRVILELKTALDKTGSAKGKGEQGMVFPPLLFHHPILQDQGIVVISMAVLVVVVVLEWMVLYLLAVMRDPPPLLHLLSFYLPIGSISHQRRI